MDLMEHTGRKEKTWNPQKPVSETEGKKVTIQPYEVQTAANLYSRSRVERDSAVPPQTVPESKDESSTVRSDQLFISSAARIYERFVKHVDSVLEEFVKQEQM